MELSYVPQKVNVPLTLKNIALCIVHEMPHVSPAELASEFLLTPAKIKFNPHLAGVNLEPCT